MNMNNVIIFRFTKDIEFDEHTLAKKLQENAAKPLGPQEMRRSGWVVPELMADNEFVRVVDGCFQIALRTEEKIIPGAVVKEMVAERAEELEREQDRRVRSKERAEIKEQVILEMLPRAFTKSSVSLAYIDTVSKSLIVGEGSAKKAENLASTLRSAIGSLPIAPLSMKMNPAYAMTSLVDLKKDFDHKLAPGSNLVLTDPSGSGTKITCSGVDVHSDEIRKHIDASLQVTTMDFVWDENVSFSANDEMQLKKIRFGENLMDQADAGDIDDPAGYYDAMFSVFLGVVRDLSSDLISLMGGENTDAYIESDEDE
jgi:recombination associated protein RdgC